MLLAVLAVAAALEAPPADLQAVGVVTAHDGRRSVAVLRAGGRARLVAVGETAFGGKVVAIAAERVILEFAEQRVELRLTAGPDRPNPAPAPAVRESAPHNTAEPTALSMERREVERRMTQEVPRILAETTAVPVMDNGRVAGLALTRVPEGSLLTDAGLRAGDVLVEVNGTAIDSVAALMALYPRLQGESTLRAVVLRNGQPVALTVTLR